MASSQTLAELEPVLRLAAFAGVFAAIALWEAMLPRRRRALARKARWPHNLGLLGIDIVVSRLTAPGATLAVAVAAELGGWGLLNAARLPPWLELLAAIVLLDLAVYFQHVMFHAVPTLWRLHRVHHADVDFDVTTGIRFHPVEILLSALIKCAAVAAIGAPVVAVLVFEILLNATALFNHANASLPASIERWLRWMVVTPDMHRVHHSIRYDESSSNFGFNLPWWDRLFGTYEHEPGVAHEAMIIGVDAFRDPAECRLSRLLLQPFRATPGRYPINRRQEVA
ncbi:MAG: sterol desaturase family protein [Betaproteobacteria bacterium]|nr:MAG: sterol desaturase family protein [Betaproteobacteria bacterium]